MPSTRHRTVMPAALLAILLTGPAALPAETVITTTPSPGVVSESVHREAEAAMFRALDWLAAHQRASGGWSNTNFPALTALPLWAIARSGSPAHTVAAERAIAYLRTCVQPDGGIYVPPDGQRSGGLSTYNTAVAMTALHATGDATLHPIILDARTFIAGSQHFGDDRYDGGFGYDRDSGQHYADLMNTAYAMQAMRLTQDIEDIREGATVDIDWSRAVRFVTALQHQDSAGGDQAGGFIYQPGASPAGETTGSDGQVVFRAYGSMTYAGLLALVYARIDRTDVRVRSAFQWSAEHWSLQENPGMGNDGLFFFYNVLARALDAYGADMVPRPDDQLIDWRNELVQRLLALQRIDPQTGHGFWVNDSGRFWESDRVLVTAFSLLALQDALGL